MKLMDIVDISSGQPQFRIKEETGEGVPIYSVYSQSTLEQDLCQSDQLGIAKQIRTFDVIDTLVNKGDILFSLISGETVRVGELHHGFFYTQNYVKLVPKYPIDSQYLVYLLNETLCIRKQLKIGLQGSEVMKYTLQQLKALLLPKLPTLSQQSLIGDIYFKQQKLCYLKHRCADTEQLVRLEQLRKLDVL